MSPEEKLARAAELKEDGTKEFTSGNHAKAAVLYKEAADYVDEDEGGDEPLPDTELDVYVKCMSNAAMCYAKGKNWSEVVACCNKVFEKAPDEARTNVKVLYRRGHAKMQTGDLGAAGPGLSRKLPGGCHGPPGVVSRPDSRMSRPAFRSFAQGLLR